MSMRNSAKFIIAPLLMCSYLFAQDQLQEQVTEPQLEPQAAPQPAPQPQQILSPKDIPQGFAPQVLPPPAAEPAPEPQSVTAAPPPPATEPVVDIPKIDPYPDYETFLDSVELFAKLLFPAKQKLDSLIRIVNEESLQPKGQYEKQADYDNRAANFEKNKQQKVAALEKEHNAKQNKATDNLVSVMKMSRDIQPDWDGMLEQNADVDEYKKRIDKFSEKISDMNTVITRIDNLLLRLNLKPGDLEALSKKNQLYIIRLERAGDLMRDYILQEQVKVLSTEKKVVGENMNLGTYDVEKEEFPLNIRDISSTVRYDYHGLLKSSPGLAQIIDGKTDGFTVSIDYVNYPFVVDGEKVYPGAKNAHIYFRDQEISSTGAFKSIDGYDRLEGYVDWAVRADSLISGKITPKNLAPSYAMEKVRVGPPFWNTKRVLRAVAFGFSAASLGVGIWQNSQVSSKTKDANKLYEKTRDSVKPDTKPDYDKNAKDYKAKVSSLESSMDLRDGFYISAGVFGFAGVVSFFF